MLSATARVYRSKVRFQDVTEMQGATVRVAMARVAVAREVGSHQLKALGARRWRPEARLRSLLQLRKGAAERQRGCARLGALGERRRRPRGAAAGGARGRAAQGSLTGVRRLVRGGGGRGEDCQ